MPKKIETLDVLGDALTTILATDLDIANSVDVTLKNGALYTDTFCMYEKYNAL